MFESTKSLSYQRREIIGPCNNWRVGNFVEIWLPCMHFGLKFCEASVAAQQIVFDHPDTFLHETTMPLDKPLLPFVQCLGAFLV